jgi:hypothetical protein
MEIELVRCLRLDHVRVDDRPTSSSRREKITRARVELAKGVGIGKVARLTGLGTGTVHKLKCEMAANVCPSQLSRRRDKYLLVVPFSGGLVQRGLGIFAGTAPSINCSPLAKRFDRPSR